MESSHEVGGEGMSAPGGLMVALEGREATTVSEKKAVNTKMEVTGVAPVNSGGQSIGSGGIEGAVKSREQEEATGEGQRIDLPSIDIRPISG